MTEQLQKKVDRAIKLIKSASKIAAANGCPQIEVAYSGGKDSDVILELTKMSGVPYRAIYKVASTLRTKRLIIDKTLRLWKRGKQQSKREAMSICSHLNIVSATSSTTLRTRNYASAR